MHQIGTYLISTLVTLYKLDAIHLFILGTNKNWREEKHSTYIVTAFLKIWVTYVCHKVQYAIIHASWIQRSFVVIVILNENELCKWPVSRKIHHWVYQFLWFKNTGNSTDSRNNHEFYEKSLPHSYWLIFSKTISSKFFTFM